MQKKLQETFQREKKVIEDRYATELRAKSKELQEILTKERKQRVAVRPALSLLTRCLLLCEHALMAKLHHCSRSAGDGELPCAAPCAEHCARELVDVRSVQPPGTIL